MLTLVHTHGIAGIDYSSMTPNDLFEIQKEAEKQNVQLLPGIFLRREYVDGFEEILNFWNKNRLEFKNIKGFSIEGPMLGANSGVPPRGVWIPTASEWRRFSKWGSKGLCYIVIAPDASPFDDDLQGITYREILDEFYSNGVRVALGHFRHDDSKRSANALMETVSYIWSKYATQPSDILTDHLFNDMPRNFIHSWRGIAAQERRYYELASFLEKTWSESNLPEVLGDVPAMIISLAKQDKLMPFLNFDGEHVAIEICKKTLDYLGEGRVIGITDDTSIPKLAGEELYQQEGSSLWYRGEGVVAAGTLNVSLQIDNMRRSGFSDQEIEDVFVRNTVKVVN